MEPQFPQFQKAVNSSILLENFELTHKETSSLQKHPGLLSFYSSIESCKQSKDNQANVKCVISSISKSSCSPEFTRFTACAQRMKRKGVSCAREDKEIGYCVDTCVSQILKVLSQMPQFTAEVE